MRFYGGCADEYDARRQAGRDAERDFPLTRWRPDEPYDCDESNEAYRRAYRARAEELEDDRRAEQRAEERRREEREEEERMLEEMRRQSYEQAQYEEAERHAYDEHTELPF